MVRHKCIYSCKRAIYFDLVMEIIKQNCDFVFYFYKSDITLTVLDGGNEIILVNCPDDKHIICTVNNDIPIEIPSHPYILVNRSVLCNCRIEAENNYLLESLAACHDSSTKLVMYFTVNLSFTNYINQFNLTEDLEAPIFTNKTSLEVTLPLFLNKTIIDDTLFSTPLILKEYLKQYKHDLEIFDLKEQHDNEEEIEEEYVNTNFFNSTIVKIFKFVVAIILIIATVVTIYTMCKHNKLRALVTSLAFQQTKEIKAEKIIEGNHSCEYTAQFYITLTLSKIIIGLVVFMILQVRRIKLCRG